MQRFSRLIFLSASLSLPLAARSDECARVDTQEVAVHIDTAKIVRGGAPKALFGFNVPWRDFQLGYFRNGAVRPEVIAWLAPFQGAAYRYPGGSPSNWFEWRKSVGPVQQRRAQLADFDRYSVAEFGLNEFAEFVSRVGGRAIFTINLAGPYGTPLPSEAAASDAAVMMAHVRASTRFGCVGGAGCAVIGWELGNELDWSPFRWPAETYAKRAMDMVTQVSGVMPEAKWIAGGRTAPWDAKGTPYKTYNAVLASALGRDIDAIAIHPYYDGISVPAAANYVAEYGRAWAAAHTGASVYVTEHARWPAQPATGRWETNWYQATGLGGAISTADFLLAIVQNPQVAGANWHALGVEGPWQLIRWDKDNDRLFPSPVYWALRVLRDAYLDNTVLVRYEQPARVTYSAGYDLRMIGMASSTSTIASLLGVNRSDQPYRLHLHWTGTPRSVGQGTMRWITGKSEAEDNTPVEPGRIEMKSSALKLSAGRSDTVWCVRPHAVFSVVEP